jgi:hypothetical protein
VVQLLKDALSRRNVSLQDRCIYKDNRGT